jgi:FlaA1/EpsC-like NDP-sugar epimerase
MKRITIDNIRYLPRWSIFCMDFFLSLFSIIISYLLRFNFDIEDARKDFIFSGVLIMISLYLVGFLCFKSYKQIIRHTTLHGITRILLLVLFVNISIVLLNILSSDLTGVHFVPYSILVINSFISFCLLSVSRILIKKLFEIVTSIKKEPIIIFGAGTKGLATSKLISGDKSNNLRVIAFIDDDEKKIGKNLEDVPIYGFAEVQKLIKRHSIQRGIIAVKNISFERKNEIASTFIQLGLKISIPATQQFSNNLFTTIKLRDIRIEDLLEREPINIHNTEINKMLKDKRILITGAAGSIGSEIVRQVANFQPEIIILCDIAESPLHSIGLELEEIKGIKHVLFIGNVCNEKRMKYIFRKHRPNVVFHAAAYKHVPLMEDNPREAIFNNVLGSRILADLSVLYDVERFVLISTDKAVNPTNVMGATKRIAEMYIQSMCNNSLQNENRNTPNLTKFITTRFGNVLASNGSVVPTFKSQLEKGGPITVTHPEITRFFMTIPEATQLVLEAAVMGSGGEIFVFDMGKSVKILDLAKKMITLAGFQNEEDIKILFTGLRPGEKLYEEVLSNFEDTLPTYNEKIKLARAKPVNHSLILDAIELLVNEAKKELDWECVKIMKKIVPEFVSNNSKFNSLDNQQKGEMNVQLNS